MFQGVGIFVNTSVKTRLVLRIEEFVRIGSSMDGHRFVHFFKCTNYGSLLSVLNKEWNTVFIKDKLVKYLNLKAILSDVQFGLMKGKINSDALPRILMRL